MSTIRKTIEEEHKEKLEKEYTFEYCVDVNLTFLQYANKYKYKHNSTINDIIITVDTETSKTKPNTTFFVKKKGKTYEKYNPVNNIVVCWTISIATYDKLLLTIWGNTPTQLINTIDKIHNSMQGYNTMFWVHNLPYDYNFIRQYMFEKWGYPASQLNIKSHYMISIEFENGIIFKDSLVLAQRKLEKWAIDLNVLHQKAVGNWDYNKLRTQKTKYTKDELIYIENDTLVLAECLQKMCDTLSRKIYQLPFTATGIVRQEVKKVALKHNWKETFDKIVADYDDYLLMRDIFHGGYCHANRYHVNQTILGLIQCYDFASSYPYVLISEKFPMGKYDKINIADYKTILKLKDDYSFLFKATFVNIKVKKETVMPFLQFSKTKHTVNVVKDNGRIISGMLIEIPLCEIDLEILENQYDFDEVIIENCIYTRKDYLPKWFTDTIYQFFIDKTKKKDTDKIQYQIAKGMLNSLFGMCAQIPVKPDIIEDYKTGDFNEDTFNQEESYNIWKKKKTSILPYQWGIYTTAYATKNLFDLGKCCKTWFYSDTDSIYGEGWDKKKVNVYNKKCKDKLKSRGYSAVKHNNKDYWLGVAEHEEGKDDYSEFRTLGAKRYCGRSLQDNELHLTVSGVPKKAVTQLDNNIRNFKIGMIFKGEQSGKLTHFYLYNDKQKYNGNELADCVDLCPCDYELSSAYDLELEDLLLEEIGIFVYEEE